MSAPSSTNDSSSSAPSSPGANSSCSSTSAPAILANAKSSSSTAPGASSPFANSHQGAFPPTGLYAPSPSGATKPDTSLANVVRRIMSLDPCLHSSDGANVTLHINGIVGVVGAEHFELGRHQLRDGDELEIQGVAAGLDPRILHWMRFGRADTLVLPRSAFP